MDCSIPRYVLADLGEIEKTLPALGVSPSTETERLYRRTVERA
jgi:hypothetical protein